MRTNLFVLWGCLVAGSVMAEQPNVILIMTDDQGYGDLSCHGNPTLQTPHLDALYREAVRLTDFHVSPFCTPTRAALLTGRYPARTGAYRTSSGRTMMHTDERTIADVTRLMVEAGVRHMLVADGDRIGMVSIRDVIEPLLEAAEVAIGN